VLLKKLVEIQAGKGVRDRKLTNLEFIT